MNDVGALFITALSIDPKEVRVQRRGFQCAPGPVAERLEEIGTCFLAGYHAALEHGVSLLPSHLESCVSRENAGFAFEGAGMALAILDGLTPWRPRRLPQFIQGAAKEHVYMAHVGAGWAIARIPWLRWNINRALASMDPLLRWLAMDGYGFHEGYFNWMTSVRQQRLPRGMSGYARRAFDQGLGRSLWFVEGGSPKRVAATIAFFVPSRQADLWSGVGLASAYAGGVSRKSLIELSALARGFEAEIAQGVAFAAKTRDRAGNPAEHTAMACDVLCGLTARDAAGVTDRALEGLAQDSSEVAYETWRSRIRKQLHASLPSWNRMKFEVHT